jgi:hypothetical protein
MGAATVSFSFVSLNTIPHDSKTSSICRTVFMLLSIEGPSAVFLFLTLRNEFSKPRSTKNLVKEAKLYPVLRCTYLFD